MDGMHAIYRLRCWIDQDLCSAVTANLLLMSPARLYITANVQDQDKAQMGWCPTFMLDRL